MIEAFILSAFISLAKPVEAVQMKTPDDLYIMTIDERKIDLSASDIDLIERCVMSEAGGESPECQRYVATAILNRLACPDKFPDSVPAIIYDRSQFSIHNNGDVTYEVKLSVLSAIALYGGSDIPYQLYYFRAAHYHNFGIPFKKIDNTYFSLSSDVLL